MSLTWYDGICKKCGSVVIETDSRLDDCPAALHSDYKNKCTNEECEHSEWYYVGDQEFADYYEHEVKD
jgi:hypothetical protein